MSDSYTPLQIIMSESSTSSSEDISDADLALLLPSSSDSSMDDYLNMHLLLTGNCYLSARPSVPRAPSRLGWLLYQLDGERFKQEVRASRPMFWELVARIEQHPVFANRSKNKQAPVPE
ncbi:hypothetical protein RI367_008812 [Sorochytrium milnesiophthora]